MWLDLTNKDFQEALRQANEDGSKVNNISPIILYSIKDGVKVLWMGDMEQEFCEKIMDSVDWPRIDILFVPHHGRDSAKIPTEALKRMSPKIIVLGEAPAEFLNYYQGYQTIKQNSAGSIVFECNGDYVYIYVEKDYYESFLQRLDIGEGTFGDCYYIGSFTPYECEKETY